MSEKRVSEAGVYSHTTSVPQIQKLVGDPWDNRLFNPITNDGSSELLLEQVNSWKSDDMTVVFTSGCFDLMHLTHVGYLADAKLQGVPFHIEKVDGPEAWDALCEDEKIETAQRVLGSGVLKLVVSVDGDDWVMKRKGFQPEKGNSTRPIYSWLTRARSVAAAMHETSDTHTFIPIADAVTIHDPVSLSDTPHRDTIPLAKYLKPNVWSVFHESEDILAVAPEETALANTKIVRIDNDSYFHDKLVGSFSTTAIVKRITGNV